MMRRLNPKLITHILAVATAMICQCFCQTSVVFAQATAPLVVKVAPSDGALAQRIARAAAMAEAKANAAVTNNNAAANQGAGAPLINVDALPKPLVSSSNAARGLDLEALAAKYASSAQLPQGPTMLAFVSLSLPAPSLQKLLIDAERYGVTLVIRGMVGGSLTQTAIRVQKLLGTRKVAWVIDSEAFKRYSVQAVPTYVFVRDGSQAIPSCGAEQCTAPNGFVQLAGDVPIRYALDQFQTQQGFKTAVEQFQATADRGARP
jgi:conjugal transfer pilus assembly protein TrbC